MIINDFQVNGLFPSVVSAAVTTAQYFPRILGTSIGVQSVAPSASSAAGQLVVPGNNELNGQWFQVLVGATFSPDASDSSATGTLELVANTGTILTPIYTVVATATTAAPAFAGSQDVALKVSMYGTTKSGIVQGSYTGVKGGVLIAATTLTNNLSGINFGQANPPNLSNPLNPTNPFGLVVRATFSSAVTSPLLNVARLYQFQIAAD
jgi:hypothetical protein